MQSVEQEQAPDDLIGAQASRAARRPLRPRQVAQDSLQPDPVQVEDGLDDLADPCPRRGIGEPLGPLEQVVEALELAWNSRSSRVSVINAS